MHGMGKLGPREKQRQRGRERRGQRERETDGALGCSTIMRARARDLTASFHSFFTSCICLAISSSAGVVILLGKLREPLACGPTSSTAPLRLHAFKKSNFPQTLHRDERQQPAGHPATQLTALPNSSRPGIDPTKMPHLQITENDEKLKISECVAEI